MCRLALLGNSATASWCNDLGRTVGRAAVKAAGTSFFFRARSTSFHTHPLLILTLLFCFFVLIHFYCSHARVFEETLVHEFHISYSHTEWNFFSDSAITSAQCLFGA